MYLFTENNIIGFVKRKDGLTLTKFTTECGIRFTCGLEMCEDSYKQSSTQLLESKYFISRSEEHLTSGALLLWITK